MRFVEVQPRPVYNLNDGVIYYMVLQGKSTFVALTQEKSLAEWIAGGKTECKVVPVEPMRDE